MTEGSLNPIEWNWTHWPFALDWGSMFDITPLVNTAKAMFHAVPSLMGDDESEGRLRAAAAAHESLAQNLDKVFDVLDGHAKGQGSGYLDRVVKEWKGTAAEEFRKVWGEVVKQDNRTALKKSSTDIAQILRMVADSAALTKKAILELLRTALLWGALFMAFKYLAARFAASMAGGLMAQMIAYIRTRQLVLYAVQVMIRFGTLLRTLATALKNLPVVGRLLVRLRSMRAVGAMEKAVLQAAKNRNLTGYAEKFAQASFKNYARTSGSVYGGIIGTQMAAQGMSGHSIFNLSPISFTQAARITTGAMLVATFAPASGFFGKGLLQGGTAASWAATLTKTGAAVGESGMAFGSFVGLRNWTYEQIKHKLPGARVAGKPGNFHKQFWGGIPTSLFRVWRPLQTNPDFGELPDTNLPTANGQAVAPRPDRTEKVGYWPVDNGSLYDIAEKVYGDPNRWREIYAANREVIGDDPRKLVPGQLLRIPLDE
ncbi:LysM peptidoglycan-binding domain-containing protein [Nonomuraea sp. NEAU-A123]|uniref:LysM peptidoglycan-binding domain-containing protein n=1 Tax=Nonomuraea sp. NEAU-A123 TaxID=2839649 RepID=UPI001BE3F4A5|nr:hypothetical protein [Nonomuraea sp. NEAU-A123]MBT2224524.1 hypothetical protein [Nonomuraea sp. NEAU-A123]